MARINQQLFAQLKKRAGVANARLYVLIQKKAHDHNVPRHIGALLLAGDYGISVTKYAKPEDYAQLRGVVVAQHVPASAEPVASTRHATRKGRQAKIPKTKENTVFVVHGRDAKLRDAIYQFLGALGLDVLEWGHAIRAATRGKGGNPYVGDAVNKIMEQAQAIVVMLSPDDEAKLKDQFVTKHERRTEAKLRGQARPNVIFETGIAIGTHHRKTVMVHIGDVKPFTDVGGMHIPQLSNDAKTRHEFANRLEDLGCKINTDGDHWLRAGDFTPTPPKKPLGRS